jgi:hypothetical protein
MRLFAAGLLGWLTLFQVGARPATDLLADGSRLSGGVFDLYSGTEAEPAVVVHLEKAYTDYQSKGFFRIGLLPIGVMEGVTFRLQHPDSATNCLALMHQWLAGATAKRLELRRVSFLVSPPAAKSLETGRARVAANGRLELLDGVRFVAGTNQVRAARGVLQITGEQAGQLVLETTPPWTNSLLSHLETPKP